MPGVLRVRGTINVGQFWPHGESDADTSKVLVTVASDSFSYARDGKNFKVTHAFEGAHTVGKSRKPVIDKQGRITVRLQGIDAPELHYRAGPLAGDRTDITPAKREAFNVLNRPTRRQYWGEIATVALAEKLAPKPDAIVACEVRTAVDYPYEVVDTYGRVVGNIYVGKGFNVDVNTWLAAEGWAFPTFYSSMSNAEIRVLLAAMKQGKRKRRVWSGLTGDTAQFDPNLLYRKGGPIDAAHDRGPVLMPKIYRRKLAYQMEKGANIISGSFQSYIKRVADACFELEDFLRAGVHAAKPRMLDEFFLRNDFIVEPQQLVFKEKYSSVVEANGKRVERF